MGAWEWWWDRPHESRHDCQRLAARLTRPIAQESVAIAAGQKALMVTGEP